MAPRLVMYLAETSIAENPKVLGRSGEVARAAAHRGSRQGRSRLPGTTSSAVPVAGEHLRVELRLSARHRDLELPQGAPPCRAAPRDRGSPRGRAPCEGEEPVHRGQSRHDRVPLPASHSVCLGCPADTIVSHTIRRCSSMQYHTRPAPAGISPGCLAVEQPARLDARVDRHSAATELLQAAGSRAAVQLVLCCPAGPRGDGSACGHHE